MQELFFEIIRVAIGTQDRLSRLPLANEWGEIFELAKKQSLVGICFVAIQRLGADPEEGYSRIGMSEETYFTWMGLAGKIHVQNEIVNRRCVEVQHKIEEAGFRTYIMKGQANAFLYGDELCMFRQPGDIDIFLDGGFDKIMRFVNDTHPTDEVNELEIHYHCYEDTEVEIHYRPFIMRNPWKNKKLQAFFKSHEEACFANRICLNKESNSWITTPTSEFNLVHQMAHIRLHLFTEGVGMRQLMDYYFVLRNTNYHELPSNFSLIFKQLGMDRFASALMWVLGYVFGLPREQMLWEPNEVDGRLLLDEVMNGGNFGRYNEEQNRKKTAVWYRAWAVLFRNIHLWRFDRSDWFWGPVWRVGHKLLK